MSDSDTPKYSRKRQDSKKHKRGLHSRCRWTLWVPVSVLVLLAVCLYFRGHPSAQVANWGSIRAIKTSDQNLTNFYKVAFGKCLHLLMWQFFMPCIRCASCSDSESPNMQAMTSYHLLWPAGLTCTRDRYSNSRFAVAWALASV